MGKMIRNTFLEDGLILKESNAEVKPRAPVSRGGIYSNDMKNMR